MICRERPWPCCTDCTPKCVAGCGDPSKVVSQRGMVVGAFCRPCFNELAHGKIPRFRPRVPRRPRGLSLRDLQDAAA